MEAQEAQADSPSTDAFALEQTAEWLKHLDERGYVVIRGVATPDEVECACQPHSDR
jgi:hypothetical protein